MMGCFRGREGGYEVLRCEVGVRKGFLPCSCERLAGKHGSPSMLAASHEHALQQVRWQLVKEAHIVRA